MVRTYVRELTGQTMTVVLPIVATFAMTDWPPGRIKLEVAIRPVRNATVRILVALDEIESARAEPDDVHRLAMCVHCTPG